MRFPLVSIAAAAALLAGFGTAATADPLAPSPLACTTLNCGAISLPGRLNGHPPGLGNQWITQIAGTAGNCLRLDVTSESQDLAMSAVAPSGVVFTNDNGGSPTCANCPRVVVAAAANGFYTVVIAQRSGANVEAGFVLKVGLYKAGNRPNCVNPTKAR